jgi:hypothetical protein
MCPLSLYGLLSGGFPDIELIGIIILPLCGGFMSLVGIALLLWARSKRGAGEGLAISVKKPHLRSEGYDTFLTTSEYNWRKQG